MKFLTASAFLLLLASCGQKESVSVINGKDGQNGHSLVSEYVPATECVGDRLDVFIDLDDSLSVSEGDKYQSSIIACDGQNGLAGVQGIAGTQGPQGIQGNIGPQGLTGGTGAVGATGSQGPVGPAGAQGSPGEDGDDGVNATAAITTTTSGCNLIAGTEYYSYGSSIFTPKKIRHTVYNCGNLEESLSNGKTFWVADNILAVPVDGTVIRLIKFN